MTRHSATARPFEWKLTRHHLEVLLSKIQAREQTLDLAIAAHGNDQARSPDRKCIDELRPLGKNSHDRWSSI
jgi:hypothetical protein